MNILRMLLVVVAGVLSVTTSSGQTAQEKRGLDAISVGVLKAQEDFLASHWMEGRYSTEKGAMLASDYIASMLGVYGVLPAGDGGTYFQSFGLVRYSHPANEEMSISNSGKVLLPTPNVDYYIKTKRVQNSFRIDADAVFAGYGLYLPKYGIDCFGKIDVRNKVLIVKDFGSDIFKMEAFKDRKLDPKEKQAILDNAALEAKRRGAVAIVYYSNGSELTNSIPYIGKARSVAEDNLALPSDSTSTQVIAFALSSVYLRDAMKDYGVDIDRVGDKGLLGAVSTSIRFKMRGDVTGEVCKVRNVVGMIQGEDTTQTIVVGAHYDHYGLWGTTLYPGADDNASGTVGVLTMAKAFKESGIKPKVNVVFGFWTCEEKGLWGSTYYCRNPFKPMRSTKLYVNYDMIGRSSAKDTLSREATYFYYEKKPMIDSITKQTNDELGGLLSLRARPTLGGLASRSDHGPFSVRGVPFMGWMTAFHDDYHQPTDTPDKIDYKKLQKVVQLGFINILRFGVNSF